MTSTTLKNPDLHLYQGPKENDSPIRRHSKPKRSGGVGVEIGEGSMAG